jgi:hypothetical protein
VVIFPVTLMFIVMRSWHAGDLRELLVAPLSAGAMTAIGYPLAVAACSAWTRCAPRLASAGLLTVLVVGIVTGEALFWLLVAPFWWRDYSITFCSALVAACALSTAAALRVLDASS